ncbi:MAG: tryptophan--tRNA ligase [Patescibacteria group bacterium]
MTKRVLSGIQPTGVLHIGNYLGSLKHFVELQNKYECFFFIADYHSITEDYNPQEKPQQVLDLAIDFLSAGLDPQKCTIFVQSQVPEHLELAWIFNTITPVSELQRMTQYKDKSRQQPENINMGLFDYPVLQAADILIYKPQFVPVGIDQKQHVELTRKIARLFNNKFGEVFPEPDVLLTKTPKIMSLADPTKKMSKSFNQRSYIALNDEPAAIKDKMKRAVTDTGKSEKSPGVQNLFMLLQQFGGNEIFNQFEKEHRAGKISYQKLKEALADAIGNYFADFRSQKKELSKDTKKVKDILEAGNKKAREIAIETLIDVKKKIGLT